jgi:primosomal protein N' (replication factor Y)
LPERAGGREDEEITRSEYSRLPSGPVEEKTMSDSPVFIDVAIPLPISGPFTYIVPEALRPRVGFGVRVLVPFRNKIRAGFVVDTSRTEPPDTDIREIVDIPTEPSYLTTALWEFILWTADYYLLPRGRVLSTALPPGSDRRSRPWAVLTSEGRKWFGGRGGDDGLTLPAKFIRSGVILRSELTDAIGAERLDEALKREWIRIEERIARPRVSLRKHNLPELLDPADSRVRPLEEPPEMTRDQVAAFRSVKEAVDRGGFNPFLLFGVTGSGKTEVYLRAISAIREQSKQSLVLVPEIALTPQLARRFLRRLGGGVALFHSGLTRSQRLDEWRRIRTGSVDVVIAARSGIFVPLENLGLIIVDEEHDPSYKQQDRCPYNARDMALARGKLEDACVILGSATPSFESFVNAQRGRITRLDLPSRHHGGKLPAVRVVDLKDYKGRGKTGAFLTPVLLKAVEETLARKEQAVLFLNRRGFDTFVQCRSCGEVLKCPNCDVTLTHHKRAKSLQCHLCGYSQAAPPLCAACGGADLFFGGVGTQKVVDELTALFPDARIERLDRDSTRKRADLEGILSRFGNKEIDILAGTQMIVKGHDFPGISLVGVLCGDLSLHFPDFRAGERTFQMITQAAGRTGRASDSGRVILQTFDPDHDAIRHAATHSYEAFFEGDSVLRKELLYPPYGRLILIRVEGNNEKRVEKKAIKIGRAARLLKGDSGEVLILGPAPAPRKKVIGRFRWQLLLKAETRAPVRNLVRRLMDEGYLKGTGFKILVDVDPVDML